MRLCAICSLTIATIWKFDRGDASALLRVALDACGGGGVASSALVENIYPISY